jgi:hypothetical protein
MIFATPETIKQPQGGDLILEDVVDQDYVLGANNPKNLGEVLVEDGDWTKFDTLWELQRNKFGWDNWSCVTYSLNKVHQFIIKRKYGATVNFSDRFVAVGSGTVPNRGNSMKGVAEWKRKNGFLWEEECPFTPEMGEQQYFAQPTKEQFELGKTRLELYGTNYMYLGGVSNENLLDGLQVSPLQVAVETPYVFNSNGELINKSFNYNHAVALAKIFPDGSRAVRDSETEQWLKFAPSYTFASVMVHFIEKKSPMFIKLAGSPALFSVSPVTGKLVPYENGDVYKLVNQTAAYSNIKTYPDLATLLKDYQFDTWIAAKQPWDSTSFVNSFSK